MSRAFDELESTRKPRLKVSDPMQDTFRQRYAPFSSDPVGDFIEERQLMPGRVIRPGAGERFGDPTKVITELPPTLNKPMPRMAGMVDTGKVDQTYPDKEFEPDFEFKNREDFQNFDTQGMKDRYPDINLEDWSRIMRSKEGGYGVQYPKRPEPRALVSMLEARARGGPVEAGKPYLVGERGPEVVVPKQDGTVVAGALPPGFSYADEAPAVPDAGGLPPGFSYADEATPPPTSAAGPATEAPSSTPAPPSAIPVANPATTDPFERAAVMMRRSAAGARQEGAATRAIDAVLPSLGGQVMRGAEVAKQAVQTGDIAPGDAMTAVMLANPASVAYRTGAGVARAALPPKGPQGPLQLTSRLTPEEAYSIEDSQQLAEARLEAKRVAQRLRDTGKMPPERTGAPIEMAGPVTAPPPESPLLPAQLVREFGAVRKGVELKDRLNPASPQNLTAKEQAMKTAIAPHIKSIDAVTQRTTAPVAALEAALPSLSDAVSTPGKAASVANWVRVYERAARAKFSPEARASLGLATRNLNHNLGTDLTLEDVLKGL